MLPVQIERSSDKSTDQLGWLLIIDKVSWYEGVFGAGANLRNRRYTHRWWVKVTPDVHKSPRVLIRISSFSFEIL